jgi:hypothetical protein
MAQAQTEKVLTRLADGRKEVQCDVTGLVLSSGAATILLSTVKEVSDALLQVITPAQVADEVFEYKVEVVSTGSAAVKNGVKITAKIMQLSATNTWGNATTGNVAAATFRIRAIGL